MNQFQRFPHSAYVGIRAEISRLILDNPANHQQSGICFTDRDLDKRIAFVVFKVDVIVRFMLFYEV